MDFNFTWVCQGCLASLVRRAVTKVRLLRGDHECLGDLLLDNYCLGLLLDHHWLLLDQNLLGLLLDHNLLGLLLDHNLLRLLLDHLDLLDSRLLDYILL